MDIKNGFHRGEYTVALFVDVTAAYDNVDLNIMIDQLKEIDCPSSIIRFVYIWSRIRYTQFVSSEEQTVERKVYRGLPQGAVLSPILYSLYTQGITKNLGENVQTVQFADDIAIYRTSSKRKENINTIEAAAENLVRNLGKIGLELEPRKTKLVEFNKYGHLDRNYRITLRSVDIYNNAGARFLGIWFDNKVNFHQQIDLVKGKIHKANGLLKYLNKKTKRRGG